MKKGFAIPLLSLTALCLLGCEQMISMTNQNSETMSSQQQYEIAVTEQDNILEKLPENSSATDWNLILVNPEKPLPKNYSVDLETVDNEQQIDSRIVDAWYAMKSAAKEDGHDLFFASGYRSVEFQETNYNNQIQSFIDDGLSESEAIERTESFLTEPGHSEHHTGLALDIVDEQWIVDGRGLEQEYATQESYDWLIENMTDYGFILRYPENQEDITHITFEPWHYRYVGVENAKFMEEHDLLLEEYVSLLEERDAQ